MLQTFHDLEHLLPIAAFHRAEMGLTGRGSLGPGVTCGGGRLLSYQRLFLSESGTGVSCCCRQPSSCSPPVLLTLDRPVTPRSHYRSEFLVLGNPRESDYFQRQCK
ncbi:Hypothetical protein NTJ_07174 [Nesidiocoris tenuis]|uniref:Uncharacterized protein n=1 Tax=Nesidiocoris tenuis TaxID=355587 RepID=A0ABN7ATW2_9HEMI|nr:Hypothetical protein NTJ_07174 [Nesidiocoris tenuis]